jgi:putative radical SAM enzyme (TIGR03279 family)
MPERRYGEPERVGGRIARVRFGSPAWRAGLRPGDRVVAVNGRPVLDLLDWQWATAEDPIEVEFVRDEARRTVALSAGSRPLGVEFEGVLFDGVRQCSNACSFCFVAQLPRGLRRSLYLRDDDYRLSFLHGNFITLTNLTDDDVLRIVEQRLSPLFVSLHAVAPEVRRRLIAPRGEDRALERLDELLAGGIVIHVQVVAVPGVNDGDVLRQTLEHLAPRENVASVGVVPLGFTRHQHRFSASYDAPGASETIALVHEFQARARRVRKTSWVYAADEFYLLAGVEVPPAEDYDGFPQYENGIGLVRSFVDEFEATPPALQSRGAPVVLVTGTMFAPVLSGLVQRIPGAERIDVLAVENGLLGGNVAVTGLLSGDDIARAIVAHGGQGTYLVPDIVLNSDALTLDDMTVRDIGRRSRARVRAVGSTAGDLARALAHL